MFTNTFLTIPLKLELISVVHGKVDYKWTTSSDQRWSARARDPLIFSVLQFANSQSLETL